MEKSKAPLSPAWYLAAFATFAIAWNVGLVWSGKAWDLVDDAQITSANQALQAKGESIAVFTDVVQADRQVSCSMIDVVRNTDPLPISPAPIPKTVEDDGTTWTLIAFEPEGRNNVTVKCAPKDKLVDNAQYAYATIDGFSARAWPGNILMWASPVLASIVGIVVFRIRRRQLRTQ